MKRCPGFEALSRAASGGAPGAVLDHAAACGACGASLARIRALGEAARSLPFRPPDAAAVGALEARVLASALGRRQRGRRAIPIAIAAAACVALLAIGWGALAPREDAHRGRVVAAGDARYEHRKARVGDGGEAEVVELAAGRVEVEVAHLHAGERFVVRTEDAEVEVRGTAFEVEAREGRLARVEVAHGRVEVRFGDAPPVLLGAGERWTRQAGLAAVASTAAQMGEGPLRGPGAAAQANAPGGGERAGHPPAGQAQGGVAADEAADRSAADRRRPPDVDRAGADRRQPAGEGDEPGSGAAGHADLLREAPPPVAVALAGGGAADAPDPQDRLPPPAPAAGAARASTDRGAASPEEVKPAAPDPLKGERTWAAAWEALRAGDAAAAAAGFARAAELGGDPALARDAAYWRIVALGRVGDPAAEAAMVAFLDAHPEAERAGEVRLMLGLRRLAAGREEAARPLLERAARDGAPSVRTRALEALERLRP